MQAPIQIRLLSDPNLLCVVRAAVEAAAGKFGLGHEDSDRLELAVDEALTNVIRHGYGGRTDQSICVTLAPVRHEGAAGVEVVIEDESGKVDLDRIRGREFDEVKPGGLGVSIIREACDVCDYQQRSDGRGLRLMLRKFARSGAAS